MLEVLVALLRVSNQAGQGRGVSPKGHMEEQARMEPRVVCRVAWRGVAALGAAWAREEENPLASSTLRASAPKERVVRSSIELFTLFFCVLFAVAKVVSASTKLKRNGSNFIEEFEYMDNNSKIKTMGIK